MTMFALYVAVWIGVNVAWMVITQTVNNRRSAERVRSRKQGD
jgi:hypothetical protein